MEITLKQMGLRNFKGIRELTINFDPVTNIYGQNATGKSTLMDGFLWLFFGKDSSDRTDFEIKTLDVNNQPFHGLEHEVSALILADDEEITIRRVYKEKWVTKRGEKEPVFAGHEQEFFWNEVPLKESEFKAKVAGILDEKVFKLITNTTYFNSLKWQDRRSTLLHIAGPIYNATIIDTISNKNNAGAITLLTTALNQKKSIEEFKSQIAAKKKKIKDELELIPARIDEANRSLPDALDYAAIENEILQAESEIENIDALLMTKSKAEKEYQLGISAKIKEAGELRNQNQSIEFQERNLVKDKKQQRESEIQEKKRTLRTKQDELNQSRNDYANELSSKEIKYKAVIQFREQYAKIDAEKLVFNDGEFCCPACKREFEAVDVELKKATLTGNFNKDKSERLNAVKDSGIKANEEVVIITARIGNIAIKGGSLAAEVTTVTNDIATLEEQHLRLSQNEEQEVRASINANTVFNANLEKIELLTEEINTPYAAQNNAELLQRKKSSMSLLDSLKTQLNTKGSKEKTENRITELGDQEKKLAQELANLEGTEFCIEQFQKAKMDTLEERINGRFSIVRFKMFEQQVNGGQSETCTTLIEGVPYADANTASKIAAGLDIINTLSDHYGVTAPIFIDNRESIIHIPESKSQIINLIVSAKHKKLTVGESKDKMAVA